MHQICDWAKCHEFMLYVVTFDPMNIPTFSAPQNDRLEPYFCERNEYQCSYFNWLKNYDLKCKFMTFSPVANLMHHPLYMYLIFLLSFFQRIANQLDSESISAHPKSEKLIHLSKSFADEFKFEA